MTTCILCGLLAVLIAMTLGGIIATYGERLGVVRLDQQQPKQGDTNVRDRNRDRD